VTAIACTGLQEAAAALPFLRFGVTAALVLLGLLLAVCGFQLWVLLRAASRRDEEPAPPPQRPPEPSPRLNGDELTHALRTLQGNLERSFAEEAARSREECREVITRELEKFRASATVGPAAEPPVEVAVEEAPLPRPPWPDSAKEILLKVKEGGVPVAFNSFLGVFEKKEGGGLLAVPEGDSWFLVPATSRLEDAQAFQDLYAEAFHSQGLMARGSLYVSRPAAVEEESGKEGRFRLLDKGALSIKN
jgi:hypothetical protein